MGVGGGDAHVVPVRPGVLVARPEDVQKLVDDQAVVLVQRTGRREKEPD